MAAETFQFGVIPPQACSGRLTGTAMGAGPGPRRSLRQHQHGPCCRRGVDNANLLVLRTQEAELYDSASLVSKGSYRVTQQRPITQFLGASPGDATKPAIQEVAAIDAWYAHQVPQEEAP